MTRGGNHVAPRPLFPCAAPQVPPHMIRTALLFFPLTVAALPAQSASVAFFGTGCSLIGQQLAIGVQGLPQLGTAVTITYSGPNMVNQLSVQPVLALGLSSTSIPIPQSILPSQPFGCTQWIVPEVLNLMPLLATGQFDTQLSMAIPASTSLIGFQFTAQWLALAIQCGIIPPCALDALPTSDAALLTVGV